MTRIGLNQAIPRTKIKQKQRLKKASGTVNYNLEEGWQILRGRLPRGGVLRGIAMRNVTFRDR